MIEWIQEYLRQIISAVFLIALLQAILPRGLIRRVGLLVCGLVLLLVILRPVHKIELQDLSELFAASELERMDFEDYSRENAEKMEQLITEKTQAYIWDKAQKLAFTPKEISVQTKKGEDYPYPYSVTIKGMYTQKQRLELTAWIAANLAIAEHNQQWRWE